MLTSQIKKAEKMYYQSLISENKSCMRKTWNIIKSVISKSKSTKTTNEFKISDSIYTSNKQEIANRFNDYFINVGLTLANKIPPAQRNYRDFLPPNNLNSMYIKPVTCEEMKKIISKLNEGAPGYDEVTAKCIKCVSENIIDPLVYLSNLSFNDGIFPCELKIAKVCPLYKAKDPMIFSNYRPISLLPIFSKIFERLMYNRLLKFLKKNNLLYKYQFGFLDNHSTYMPIMIMHDNITKALDKNEYAVGIFLDFQKAFDTVDHTILLDKLYIYGMRGIVLDWFRSYLNNRQQFVQYNKCS